MFTCLSVLHNSTSTDNFSGHQLYSFEEDIRHLKLVAYGFVGTAVVVFGVVGNLLNLVILTNPSLQETTYTYLACLAVSDLLTLLLGVTSLVRLQDVQPRTWISAIYYSHVELPIVNALMASSIFLVVCVTVDRYFSICHPTRFKDIHNKNWTKKAIFGTYATAFVVYVPVCLEKLPVQSGLEYLACQNPNIVDSVIYHSYLMGKEFLVRLGPVFVLVVLNVSMCSFYRRRCRFGRRYASTSSFRRKMKQERRLIVLLAAIVVSFVVCVTPASVLTLLHSETKTLDYGFQVFRAVANVLELANYAMNFYVYCFFSPDIRLILVELCRKVIHYCL